jgi:hypothetical protein
MPFARIVKYNTCCQAKKLLSGNYDVLELAVKTGMMRL